MFTPCCHAVPETDWSLHAGDCHPQGACARRERAAHAGSQAQLFWCSGSGAVIGYQEQMEVSHVTQELGRGAHGTLKGDGCQEPALGRGRREGWVKTCGCETTVIECCFCMVLQSLDTLSPWLTPLLASAGCIPEQR